MRGQVWDSCDLLDVCDDAASIALIAQTFSTQVINVVLISSNFLHECVLLLGKFLDNTGPLSIGKNPLCGGFEPERVRRPRDFIAFQHHQAMTVADLRQELRLARFADSLCCVILLTKARGFHHLAFRMQAVLLVQVVLAFIDVQALQVDLHGRISHQIGTTL